MNFNFQAALDLTSESPDLPNLPQDPVITGYPPRESRTVYKTLVHVQARGLQTRADV